MKVKSIKTEDVTKLPDTQTLMDIALAGNCSIVSARRESGEVAFVILAAGGEFADLLMKVYDSVIDPNSETHRELGNIEIEADSHTQQIQEARK